MEEPAPLSTRRPVCHRRKREAVLPKHREHAVSLTKNKLLAIPGVLTQTRKIQVIHTWLVPGFELVPG